MANQRDFSVPDDFSDVTFIVEQKKLHLSRVFLGTMSPMFKNMLTKDFAESKMDEIQLIGPPGVEMKYEEFLELMRMIHPPHRDVHVGNYECLMSLAHFYDIDFVFRSADKFLAVKDKEHRLVPLIKKLMIVDKYDKKLSETKHLVFSAFHKVSVAREIMKKPEFKTLSDGTQVKLMRAVMHANLFFDEKNLKPFTCRCENNCFRTSYIAKYRKSAHCTFCGKKKEHL